MKHFFSLITILILLFSGVQIYKASPLIFKTAKTIDVDDFADLATVDTSKYKQIRVAVKVKPDSVSQQVDIYAVEDGQEIFLFTNSEKDLNFSTVIDSPPTKIKLTARGKGTYSIFIWASQ